MISVMQPAMKLEINGETKSVAASANVRELLHNLGIKPDRIAVEVNRLIVKRQDWDRTPIRELDKIEIVQFVGGG
jgi:thiamine biosynthesis protein ThiS